eukprot:COSAG02_NODE_51_length_44689_cov_29.477361_17_plen_79_part_00
MQNYNLIIGVHSADSEECVRRSRVLHGSPAPGARTRAWRRPSVQRLRIVYLPSFVRVLASVDCSDGGINQIVVETGYT